MPSPPAGSAGTGSRGPEVARAIEALAVIAPRRRVSSLRAASAAERLREGRTCYDHLAGRLGVGITDALLARRALRASDGGFEVTGYGERLIGSIGVDVGAGLCDRLFELEWVERPGSGRAATEAGSAGLKGLLELDLARSA